MFITAVVWAFAILITTACWIFILPVIWFPASYTSTKAIFSLRILPIRQVWAAWAAGLVGWQLWTSIMTGFLIFTFAIPFIKIHCAGEISFTLTRGRIKMASRTLRTWLRNMTCYRSQNLPWPAFLTMISMATWICTCRLTMRAPAITRAFLVQKTPRGLNCLLVICIVTTGMPN